jgi:hypothetical protein
MTEKEQAALLS